MASKKSFIFLLALRYLYPHKKKSGYSSHGIAVTGIAIGMIALIGTLGVMNGLQQGYISAILEVGSYHARIHSRGFLTEEQLKEIRALPYVLSVEPLLENQALFETGGGNFYGFLLHALPYQAYQEDQNFRKKLNITRGNFPKPGEILLGERLYEALIWEEDDSVNLAALPQGRLQPFLQSFKISGTFKTGYYDYDRNMAVLNLEDGLKYLSGEKEIFYAVKLKNPNRDQQFIKKIRQMNLDVSGWREYNRAFLGALRLEKNMMIFLLSLIFIIVTVNIFQGRQREIEERSEEIAILRALGAAPKDIQTIFILQGLVIGLTGSLTGFFLGIFITKNITQIFRGLESLINKSLSLLNSFDLGHFEEIALLSGPNFYLEGIPVLMRMEENIYFLCFSTICAVISAFLASRRSLKLKPLEALKNH